nr:immunoglobulin heavy chain junction region [Macaca mulatta]MOV39013.1 immunoglobulin heavy chain junction region [Macaca mulatta]MOV39326.1 immunoglobulin heavy chain junction region [Macaca mulatta]MOV39450.1 immunoglobulin heavy chain junction region [Macaca mulatta]MOV39775.1 immunoglobulin heavy chain junction region [Macaca mulatta]
CTTAFSGNYYLYYFDYW